MNIVGKAFILTILIAIYHGFTSFRKNTRPIEDFIDNSFRVRLINNYRTIHKHFQDKVEQFAEENGSKTMQERVNKLKKSQDSLDFRLKR